MMLVNELTLPSCRGNRHVAFPQSYSAGFLPNMTEMLARLLIVACWVEERTACQWFDRSLIFPSHLTHELNHAFQITCHLRERDQVHITRNRAESQQKGKWNFRKELLSRYMSETNWNSVSHFYTNICS